MPVPVTRLKNLIKYLLPGDKDLTSRDPFRISETHQLLLLICAIYITCIVVFWPLMTVCIWSAAIFAPHHRAHKRRIASFSYNRLQGIHREALFGLTIVIKN